MPNLYPLIRPVLRRLAPETAHALTVRALEAGLGRFMTDRGFDRRCGRHLFREIRASGLNEVTGEARMFMCASGSPGTALLRANFGQLRNELVEGGYVTAAQIAADLAAMDEPDFTIPSSILWSVRGRR